MTDPAPARFELHIHPGRPCGVQPDGSSCWTQGDAHFTVPAPADPGHTPVDVSGWQAAGCVDGDDIPAAFRVAGGADPIEGNIR